MGNTTKGHRWLQQGVGVFPLTLQGLLVLGAGAFSFHLGHSHSDHVLYASGLTLMLVVGFAVLISSLSALGIHHGLRASAAGLPERLETGAELRSAFQLPQLRWLPFVELSLSWEQPSEATVRVEEVEGALYEVVVVHGRGRFDVIARRLRVHDIFGLTAIAWTMRWPHPLTVVPARAHASLSLALRHVSGDAISHPAGGPVGEMIEMRRYQPGDPMRHILWKTYARTRRLLVRQPERAIAPKPSSLAVLVAGASDEPAAGTARVFVEDGLLGEDYLFHADGAHQSVTESSAALDQIVDSARHRAEGGQALASLLKDVDRNRLENTVIFVPSSPGPWVGRLKRFSRALSSPPTVIVAMDGPLSTRKSGRLKRLFFGGLARQSAPLAELPGLYDDLLATGLDVRVLHTSSGQLLGPQQIATLRGT